MVGGDSKRAYLGLIAGLIVALSMSAGGVFLVYEGHDWAGTTMVTTVVVALVGTFVYGTRSRRSERQQKAQETKASVPGRRK